MQYGIYQCTHDEYPPRPNKGGKIESNILKFANVHLMEWDMQSEIVIRILLSKVLLRMILLAANLAIIMNLSKALAPKFPVQDQLQFDCNSL